MIFTDKQDFINQYREMIINDFSRDFEQCSDKERYLTLVRLIAAKAKIKQDLFAEKGSCMDRKTIYYFSMEFLVGRLLDSYLVNFGVKALVAESILDMGANLETLYQQERDPGLGNGGLGRLAACFLDAMASMGIHGHGNGIRYRYGLFEQAIENGKQVEKADNWMEIGYPWEVRNPGKSVVVQFGGHVTRHEEEGNFRYSWDGGERVLAVPYDVPVVGYGGESVNNLRLWDVEPIDEKFDMDAFNSGDYSGALKHRSEVEAITCILYPKDNSETGRILRLKQEYFFVAAGMENIVRSFKKNYGSDWSRFTELVGIHTNDTHPALCAPELLRILIDREGLDWDKAWELVTGSISFTNHTVLPEALEKWPIDMFRALLPRIYDFVEEIDRRYRESFPRDVENWQELLKNTAILWDGQVRMANLSIIAGHSVNGVAELHTEILKKDVFREFYTMTPEKFRNMTNGVDHRRFLLESNPPLSRLITSAIGGEWVREANQLRKLEAFKEDGEFLKKLGEAKRENKVRLSRYIMERCGVAVSPDSIFDIQVKRFHAYKRQLLNVFKIMDLYNRILDDPAFEIHSTAFIFAGKAAQGYDFAKDVIRLINAVAKTVNDDPRVKEMIKVVFIPNFSVSNGQLIYPAADISEQISTAGKEASGTGNMKFMFNGAVTLGTLDGANVEINRLVGEENIRIFGLRAEDIERMRKDGSYFAWDEYSNDNRIKRVVDQLADGSYAALSGGFNGIYDALLRNNDEFFVLKDFRDYIDSWHRLERLYSDSSAWNKVSLHNTARAGFFSSDRTVGDYAREIWRIQKRGEHI
jgi:starch phosphorylase